jgi:hypothetical protein
VPRLLFSEEAKNQLAALATDKGLRKRLKAVRAALGKMEVNLKYPGLNTHKFKTQPCPHGDQLWEAYAENKTPAAYRIFWCYDPNERDQIVIVAITEHP